MSRQDVKIKAPDGEIPAYAFTPAVVEGPWPAVIFFMDGLAIRQSLFEMSQRLADMGYFVLLPDMFWRLGPYEPLVPAEVFADANGRTRLRSHYMSSTDPEKTVSDTGACLDWLSGQPRVKGRKVGATGYCMGGGMVLRAAAAFPDRIVAGGAFHGGNLATDDPKSPHLGAPKMKAKLFVGGADKDHGFDEAQKERLNQALKDAGVEAEVVIFEGALHGYAVPDMPVYDEAAAERHWRALKTLFAETLAETKKAARRGGLLDSNAVWA